jgi:hypothetical protein
LNLLISFAFVEKHLKISFLIKIVGKNWAASNLVVKFNPDSKKKTALTPIKLDRRPKSMTKARPVKTEMRGVKLLFP